MLKNKNINILIFIIALLFVSISAFSLENRREESILGALPNELKLRPDMKDNDKANILLSKDVYSLERKEDGTFENKGLIKSYDYITNEEIRENIIFEEGDPYSNQKIIEAKNNETTSAFYSGDHFYKSPDGKVYRIEHGATTTIEAFDLQTKETLPEKITKLLFGDKAIAACGDSGGSCYSGAGDGEAARVNDPGTWDDIHDGAGTSYGYTYEYGVQVYITWGTASTTGFKLIRRGFVPIDTSALPDDATVTDASLYLTTYAVGNNSGKSPTFSIYGSTQANTAQTEAADYGRTGTTAYSDTSYTIADLGGDHTTKEYAFNAAGKSAISLDGYTKLSVRENAYDVPDINPGSADIKDAIYYIAYASEYTNTTYDPYITITYTEGGAPAIEAKPIKIPPQMIIY